MLSKLVELSIRLRGVVIAAACLVLAYGIYVAGHSQLDVYPEFAPPQVVVQTEAPGFSPEQVETLVTLPVERAIQGVGGLDSLRSQSIQGLSVVTAVFVEGTDIYRARQMLAESLVAAAHDMPEGVSAPSVAPLTSATSMVYTLGLTSTSRSSTELRTFADWTMRPRLLGVPGVAKVAVFGGDVRQIQIRTDPAKLLALGLSLARVLDAARQATGIVGAGFLDTDAQRVVVQTQGQGLTAEAIGDVAIEAPGVVPVRIRDVAEVVEGAEPRLGGALIQGEPGITLVVSSQFGANTLDVTLGIERALDELRPSVEQQGIALHPALFRPANFIVTSLGGVLTSLWVGGVLVAAVLLLFLFSVRSAVISMIAIPLSLLVAVAVLHQLGVSLNTMTLGGLAIAIGEVVDDAIIDVENILRRLRENDALGKPRSALRVVLDASIEVRGAVIYATFVVVIVFVPVLTMSGIHGRLFRPLGLAYILAVLASLGVALTLTPALCMALFAGRRLRAAEPPFAASVRGIYERWLTATMRHPVRVVATAIVLCLGAALTLPFFGGAFLPEFREGHFVVHMSAVPGTSLAESLRLGREVSAALLRNPHVRSVAQQAGRAERADDIWGTHYSEFHVDLVPLKGEAAESVQAEIRDELAKFPGVHFAIKPFLTERIEETLSGATAEVVVKVFGEDLERIDDVSSRVADALRKVEGAADVQQESLPGSPELVVDLVRARLARLGFRPLDVLEAVQAACQGAHAAEVHEGSRTVDVVVLQGSGLKRDPESLSKLLVQNADGLSVPLSQLSNIALGSGRYSIAHDGARRRQAVTCNVRGRDLDSFVDEARSAIASKVELPPGTYLSYEGAAQAGRAGKRELLLHSLLAGGGVVMLLAIVFRNARNLLLVLVNLPFALVGGVLAVFFTGGWLSVGSLVGFVTLFGITMRNSIMLISHYEHLVRVEGVPWDPDAARRGASERLIPILMTALVTGLGLLPLAIGSGEPGKEIEGPMAVIILGGLATSTALNLLVLPTLAASWARFERPESDE